MRSVPWGLSAAERDQLVRALRFRYFQLYQRFTTLANYWQRTARQIEEGTLDRSWVDEALKHGLYAIINMHHHEALYTDPKGQIERFLAQWDQIAEFFQDYPETLLFEILNEPHRNLTPALWNEFAAAALERIRKKKPDRAVLIGTADWGGLRALPDLKLPNDDRLILTIHYYNPFRFTHQGASWTGRRAEAWVGTEWRGTKEERERVRADFAPLLKFREEHDIPVHIGEFGAFSRAVPTPKSTRWRPTWDAMWNSSPRAI
jgi:endoglucanase